MENICLKIIIALSLALPWQAGAQEVSRVGGDGTLPFGGVGRAEDVTDNIPVQARLELMAAPEACGQPGNAGLAGTLAIGGEAYPVTDGCLTNQGEVVARTTAGPISGRLEGGGFEGLLMLERSQETVRISIPAP